MFKKIFRSNKRILDLSSSDWLFLVAGLTLFAFLTLWTITRFSIWFDEAFSAYLIHFSFLDIARFTATDVHPPLFYWLLKIWSMLFGTSEIALRSMSTLFGGIAILFGYLLAKKLFSSKVARISLIFMALSPMLIRYSQEVRMYALVPAIALAATYVLTFAITSKKRLPWVIYGLLICLGMWAHYFSAIIWISHWIWRADIVRRVAKKGEFIKEFFSKEWIMAHVIAIVAYIPWLYFFVRQVMWLQSTNFWIPSVTPDTPVNFMTNVVYYQDVSGVGGWLIIWFIALIAIMTILSVRVYRSLNYAHRQSYRLIIAIAFIPMTILLLASMPPLHSVFIDRYLTTSAVGIALFIGTTIALGCKNINIKWQTATIIFTALLMAIGVLNVWQLGNYNKTTQSSNNVREVIDQIKERSKKDEPIIADTPYFFCEVFYYSTNEHPVYFIETGAFRSINKLDYYYKPEIKTNNLDTFLRDNPTFWYVSYSKEQKWETPYQNWIPIQDLYVNDSISGKPIYKATQYKSTNLNSVQ